MTDTEKKILLNQLVKVREVGQQTADHLQQAARGLMICDSYLAALEQLLGKEA